MPSPREVPIQVPRRRPLAQPLRPLSPAYLPKSLATDREIRINGNAIRIYLNQHGETHFKKVSAAFMNRNSNPNVLSNVTKILEDRIMVKAKKCNHLQGRAPMWLALFNDYWLTEADTYRFALSRMSLEHSFQKILLVYGDRSVDFLYEE
jgi:hypothetical protein